MLKRFTETTLGILIIAVIPATTTYITIIEKIFTASFMEKYNPLLISLAVFIVIISLLYARKIFLNYTRKITERFNKMENDIKSLKANVYDLKQKV